MIRIIHGEIWSEGFTQLDDLIRDFQSCVRFCYNRFHKDDLKFSDVRRIAKTKYPTLNARQVADAVVQGQALKVQERLQTIREEVEQKEIQFRMEAIC